MTPMAKSKLAWLGGAVAGIVLSRERPILGGILGAILVGSIGDKLIETYDPNYTGGLLAVREQLADRLNSMTPQQIAAELARTR